MEVLRLKFQTLDFKDIFFLGYLISSFNDTLNGALGLENQLKLVLLRVILRRRE